MTYKLVTETNKDGSRSFYPYVKKWFKWIGLDAGGIEVKGTLCVEYNNQEQAIETTVKHFAAHKKGKEDLVFIQIIKSN